MTAAPIAPADRALTEATLLGRFARGPSRYWRRQSLRARITLLATALFALAVTTGALLLIQQQRLALTRVLDSSATKTANAVAKQIRRNPTLSTIQQSIGGVSSVQVLDVDDDVIATSPGGDRHTSLLSSAQLQAARDGSRFDIINPTNGVRLRVLAVPAGDLDVVVFTDLSRVDDSVRVLTRVALIGSPIAVLLLGLSTYFVVAVTLRSVAALRHGAANISASSFGAPRLTGQRLPVPSAQDEIQRLALTLNRMLDRIETATTRQRAFVGDAAHELRSPLASLRVQLEVAARIGPDTDWPDLIDDVLIDVGRLDRLVEDLLSLARLDELGVPARLETVHLDQVAASVVAGYGHARIPVTVAAVAATTAAAQSAPTVSGDVEALRRVIVNLVDNAVRYARTSVLVGVEAVQPIGSDGRGVTHRTVVLTVTDDGPGLPEHEWDRVFDRFYRVEASRSRDSGGTGLGLPIVRDLVRAHRGSVHVQARPDGGPGLQAVVTLPAA